MDEYSPAQFEHAKALYFSGTPIAQISTETGIKRTTLQYYVAKSWKSELNLRETELLKNVSHSHSEIIASMTKSAIIAVERAMSHMATRKEPPSTKEAADMMGILEKIQKISDTYKDKQPLPPEEEYVDPLA